MDHSDTKPSILRRQQQHPDPPPPPPRRQVSHYVWLAVTSPMTLGLRLLSYTFRRLIRPFSPQLIPLATGLLLLPPLVFLSLFAGFLVWKNIAVSWQLALHLQYGEGTMPYAETSLPRLLTQQPYDISLRLLVPVSESNIALGNFMTSLTLSTPSNKTLTSIRRPALVPPRSLWSILQTSATTEVDILLLSKYEPSTSNLVAKVSLGRWDGWRTLGSGEGREVSVISATLRGVVHNEGIRGLVTRFPIVFGLLSSVLFFSIAFTTISVILFPVMEWRLYRDSEEADYDQSKQNVGKKRQRPSHSRSDDETRIRKSKNGASSRSRSSRSGRTRSIYGPDIPATMLRSPERSVPLRKRKSRLDTYSGSE